ncbi:MAG: TMEM165/GDT1 family protein [Crocosphaera sp.]|nr:TMEM165/GDT1 family protein [Crocosphaera sp.]
MTASGTKETDEQNNSSPDIISKNEKSWSFWTVFSSTFLTIFVAEMGDKTQLATLLISAESQSPWVVFAGAAVALIATSLLGVLIGYWLARRLPPKTLDIAVALLLLIITGLLVGDVLNS